MIEKICINILMIFGTICGVCIMTLISYSILISLADDFGIKIPWEKDNE